jgi:hypothetical protein
MSTTTSPTLPAPGSLARQTAPSLPTLIGLEIRKSLSVRSGRIIAALAVLAGPLGTLLTTLASDGPFPATRALGSAGTLVATILLAIGVLSTAGEWTHKSVQTTFLLVPQRGRVLATKAVAMALLGLVLAAIGVGLAVGTVALFEGVSWTGLGRAVITLIIAGAAFTVIGAGIGAIVGNSAAAMTGTYLVVLAVFPVLGGVQPEIAEKVDPMSSVVTLTEEGMSTLPIVVVVAWVVVSTIAGVLITQRRSVA